MAQETPVSAPASEQSADPVTRPERESAVVLLLRRKPRWRLWALLLSVIAVLLGLTAMAAVWMYVIPAVWHWSVAPLAQGLTWEWVKVVPGLFGLIFMFAVSIWLPGGPMVLLTHVLRVFAEESEEQLARRVDELGEGLAQAESELEKADPAGLVPIVRYSRAQLEAYYKIGLTQTQRSFRYSVIAMWLGFIVILAGLAYQVLPMEHLFPAAGPPRIDITLAAIGGSVVIELIAALFLWVYRSAISQLTYFYNRQLHIHNVLLCFRMAGAMKEPDDTVRAIIDRVLEPHSPLEQQPLPSGRVLGELFGPRKAG
jgi:hypothetical protein